MKQLRCGVAGLGRGKLFVSILESLHQCKVVAVCDSNPEVLTGYPSIAAHTDFDEFIQEELDMVAIITPGPDHAVQSVKALERGIHVLCETPCAYSVDEAQALVKAVKKSGKKFMLAENYPWMGFALEFQKWHEQGMFVTIIYAEGDYTHDCRDYMLLDDGKYIPYAERSKYPNAQKAWRVAGLPPLAYTSHTLGPLLSLIQDRVSSVVGFSAGSRTTPELGTIDLETGLFQTENGTVIRLTNGFTVAHPFSLYYKIVGTKGSMIIQKLEEEDAYFYSDNSGSSNGKWQKLDFEFSKRPDGKDSTAVMTEEFVVSIVENTPPPIDIFSSLEMVIPGVLAHESAVSGGKMIQVPDFRSL